MARDSKLRKLMTLGMMIAVLGLAGGSTANASGYYRPVNKYQTVVEWKVVQQPYVTWVTQYDHCHRPYQVKVVRYKTIRVPVHKTVRLLY